MVSSKLISATLYDMFNFVGVLIGLKLFCHENHQYENPYAIGKDQLLGWSKSHILPYVELDHVFDPFITVFSFDIL